VRLGGKIRATIWENQSAGHGKWYSVVFTRSYKQGNDWKSASSFGRDDLLVVAEVARLAFHWVSEQLQQKKGDDSNTNGNGEPASGDPITF
jgi:hypothetical protein